MASRCQCGVGVVWCQDRDGRRVSLDVIGSMAGPGRYRVLDYESTPWLVEAVTERAQVLAYTDHSLACPRR